MIIGSVRQKIACELIDGELIIGKIAVEGIDNPIAEGPCVKAQWVGAIASGICIAGEIEPMAGPFFPKPWRGKKSIQLGIVSSGAFVFQKAIHFFGGGWQAYEI